MATRISDYLRANALGLVAIFIALSAGAYAVQKAPKNSVVSKSIKKGAVKRADVDPSQVQLRVGESCPGGEAIRVVNVDGSVACEVDEVGTSAGGPPSGPAGGHLAGTYPDPQLAPNVVGTAEVALDSLLAGDLGPNSVAASELADNAVDAAAMLDNAVGTNEVSLDGLGAVDLAPNAVANSEMADNAVTGTEVQAASLDAEDLGRVVYIASDLPNLTPGNCTGFSTGLTGAKIGEPVIVSVNTDRPGGVFLDGNVPFADAVEMRICNLGPTDFNPPNANYRMLVLDLAAD